jgi:hypothetical protein
MNKADMIDKVGHELRGIGALSSVISIAAEDSASCDAISDVSHWMVGNVESLGKFVNTELAHALGVNLPDKKEKAA